MFCMLRVVDQFNWDRFVAIYLIEEDLLSIRNREVEALCVRHCLGGHLADTVLMSSS